jgi:hypothetical protein
MRQDVKFSLIFSDAVQYWWSPWDFQRYDYCAKAGHGCSLRIGCIWLLHILSMPIPAGSTSHAHFASTPADPIHYDFPSDATVKQGGQAAHTVRRPTSNRTQIELSITKVTWHSHTIVNKPHPPPLSLARQPVSKQWTSMIHAIYTAPPPAVVTDELTPSK